MKLLLDIDEGSYNRIKDDNALLNDLDAFLVSIKNSIPYEERPQGKWVNTSPYDDKGECSLCCYLSKKYYKFCPNCGAEIRGKEK